MCQEVQRVIEGIHIVLLSLLLIGEASEYFQLGFKIYDYECRWDPPPYFHIKK